MGFWDWIFGRTEESKAAPLAFAVQSAPPRLPASPRPLEEPKLFAPAAPAIPPKPAPPRYGIDAAIALMRALPMDEDPELVLRVVRKTLRSTGVSVEELIENARTREGALSESIAEDRRVIDQLERDIAGRRTHIESVAKQLTETTSVRERLQEAVQTESKVGILLPPEEIARLQAEHAAGVVTRPSSRIPPPPIATAGIGPLTSVAPSSPKPSMPMPPAPKASVAPPLVKPSTPLPPRVVPSHPPKVSAPPQETSSSDEEAVPTPVTPDIDALFGSDDPLPSEPTVRKAIDVTAGTSSSEEAEKSV